MNGNHSLLEAFYQTTHQLVGNGKRNIQILIDALNDLDGNIDSDIYGAGKLIAEFQRENTRPPVISKLISEIGMPILPKRG